MSLSPPQPSTGLLPASIRGRASARSWRTGPPGPAGHLPLAAVMALSAVMNLHRLSQNGYGNNFYSAADSSMLRSLHNFFFVSFDPGGLISVDKPPLGLWLQTASAKIFGFSPASLLLPEAILGVLSVAAIYLVMVRPFGRWAALAGALTLAVFPSFVAVSRDTNLDALLIFLMIITCGLGLRACRSGRLAPLLACAFVVGLAFNTKTLAGLLTVPGIALAYLLCAPVPVGRRLLNLLAAGVLMVVVCGAWIAAVELTPASERPFVGGSTDNTELGLTFGYNGFGRVGGQKGGPNRIEVNELPAELLRRREHQARRERERRQARAGPPLSGARRHPGGARSSPPSPATRAAAPATGSKSPTHSRVSGPNRGIGSHSSEGEPSEFLPNGRRRFPITFGEEIGPLRMFQIGLNTQGGWLVPFAFAGLLAIAGLLGLERLGRRRPAPGAGLGETGPDGAAPDGTARIVAGPDPTVMAATAGTLASPARERLAALLVLGCWFLAEWALLSLSKGIIHPYYVSALGPGLAAMCGAGLMAIGGLLSWPRPSGRLLGAALALFAVAGSVAAQLAILQEDHYLHRIHLPLIVACALGLLAAFALAVGSRRSWVPLPLALCLCALLIVPGFYSASTWEAPVDGTFPEAGPHTAAGDGGIGIAPVSIRGNEQMIHYVRTHRPGSRWALLTQASDIAAPMILLGLNAGALGGYSASDPALNGPRLARLVERGQARYILLGGAYSSRGGNAASNAVLHACRLVPAAAWRGPHAGQGELVIFDCRGHERGLRHWTNARLKAWERRRRA